jgi:hypothetical protein
MTKTKSRRTKPQVQQHSLAKKSDKGIVDKRAKAAGQPRKPNGRFTHSQERKKKDNFEPLTASSPTRDHSVKSSSSSDETDDPFLIPRNNFEALSHRTDDDEENSRQIRANLSSLEDSDKYFNGNHSRQSSVEDDDAVHSQNTSRRSRIDGTQRTRSHRNGAAAASTPFNADTPHASNFVPNGQTATRSAGPVDDSIVQLLLQSQQQLQQQIIAEREDRRLEREHQQEE